MKHSRDLLALVLLALAVGCTQAALPGAGGLNGVNTVAVVRVAGWDGGPTDGGRLVDALYGQTAFISSTNTNDLKGLDLIVTDTSQGRAYVPAPNPLQPLSIPTVDHPVEIATSLRYGRITTQQSFFPLGYMDGQVLTGMLLFVRGAASPNISVVGAADVPESLRQLTNGLLVQSAGVVTAISARLTSDERNVVLYYATFDGQDGTVWERVLQHPPTIDPSFTPPFPTSLTSLLDCSGPPPTLPSTTLYICPARAVRTYQNASVSALQVLPTLATDPPLPVLGGVEGGRLGVALRVPFPPASDPTSLSASGEVRIINPALPADQDADGTSSDPFFRIARFFAPFDHPEPPLIADAPPQPPIRHLMTHPRAYSVVPDGGTPPGPPVLAYEGARLFGVLDESSCYGSVNCSGVLAVDALPFLVDGGVNANYGLLAFDNSDCQEGTPPGQVYCANIVGSTNRMLPLRFGSGIIQGLAMESSAFLPSPTSFNFGLIPLLGMATVSAESLDHTQAQIYFFDAVGLRLLNENFGPGVTNGVTLVLPGGTVLIPDGGDYGTIPFITANVGVGLYPRSESISIINEGEIPGLIGIRGIPYDAGISPDGGLQDVFAWPVPDAGSAVAANAVQVNDLLYPINLSGSLCSITVTLPGGSVLINPNVVVIGVDDGGTSIFTTPLDLSRCPGASGYLVLAGPYSEQPYLVVGSISGLLGRMQSAPSDGGPSPVFQVPNAISEGLGVTYPRFFNPNVDAGVVIPPDGGLIAGVASLPLTLQIPLPDQNFLSNIQAYYSFVISNGFLAAALPIDPVGLGSAGLYLPGGASMARIIDVNGEFILAIVAYPSSNTVIDFAPADIVLNYPNAGAITVHF